MNYKPFLAFEPLAQQEAFQLQEIQALLVYLQQHSPFYKRLFAQKDIDIQSIKSLADLACLPVTTKEDVQKWNRDFFCIPTHQMAEYMATSGTLGSPVTVPLSAGDLERLAYNEAQSFTCAGAESGDTYQLMLTLDRQFMAGMAYYQGLRKLGVGVIRTGPGLVSMQWDVIQRLKPGGLVAVPSFLLKMIHYAEQNGIDYKNSGIRKAVCIGEPIRNADCSWNTLGKKIKEKWDIDLYSTYASTEMQSAFTDCSAGQGGHIQNDLAYVEILDEDNRPVPAGQAGEITVTTLGIEAMPLLRYKTGDIGILYNSPCSCGRHSGRLSPILGRKQQMIKYKGTTLYPPALFDMLNQVDFVKEYVAEVFTNETGLDELLLHLHSDLEEELCRKQLLPLLQARLRVTPALRFYSAEAIAAIQFPPDARKQVRFIDKR